MQHPHHRACRLAGLALALFVLAARPTPAAAARHDGKYLHQVSTELATPCVPFAKPYARGKVRALFLVPRTFCAREVVELWQRLDLEFEAVTFYHSREPGGADVWENSVRGGTPEEKLAELRGKLAKPYDAIVLANVAFDALPVECQYTLLKKVSEGTGLLLAYNLGSRLALCKNPLPDGREDLLAGTPWAGLDLLQTPGFLKAVAAKDASELPAKTVGTYRFHRGRIATLNWPGGGNTWYGGSGLAPREDWSLHWDANYDHYLSLVAKALLWTMPEKAPRVSWTAFPPDGVEVPRADLSRAPWKVGLRATGQPIAGELRVRVRSHDNRIEFEEKRRLTVPPAGVAVEVAPPGLPCGGHYLDVAFASAAGVEQWGSAFFRVTAPVRIAGLTVEPECVEKGRPISGRLALTAPAPAGMAVRFEWRDTLGRLVARRDVSLAPGQSSAAVSFDSRPALTIAQVVTAELRRGADVVERRSAFAFVPRRNSEQFPMTLWGAGGRAGLGMTINRQFRSVGFDAILAHPSADGLDERAQAIADLAPVPYSYRVMGNRAEDGTGRDGWLEKMPDGCIANPALRDAARQKVQERIKNVIPYGPPYYTLGDENYFDYYPNLSATDRAGFREFLKREYRDLSDLNAHWGTGFTEWAAVEPPPDEQAVKEGRFAIVHDRRSYLEAQYAFYHEWLRDAIRAVDPGARVGAEGSIPGDLERTIANLEVWSPYMDRRGDVMLLSLAKPGLVRGMWWGGYVLWRDSRHDSLVLWDQLLRGAANCNFFYCSQGSEGVMAPGMNWAEYFKKMLPGFAEIRGGIGQTLSDSTLADDGVYVHSSMANVHAATLCAPFGSCEAAQDVAFNLLDALRLNYRFITRKQVEAGDLARRGVKLLLLPGAQCLSDVEAEQIRRFAEAGGTVLADVDVGTRDEHLAARPAGVLDGLFGVRRTGPKQPVETPLDLRVDVGGRKVALVATKAVVDASVAGGGAAGAAGGHPVLFRRQVGKGRAVLLNFALPQTVGSQPPAARDNAVHLLGALAGLAGVTPAFTLETKEPLQARMLAHGGVRTLGVWHLYPTKGGAKVRLAAPAWVYDVRRGKALGRTREIVIPDGRDWPRLYALLPAGGTTLAVTAGASASAVPGASRGIAVRLRLNGPAPAGRVVRVQCFGPAGQERAHYRRYPRMAGAAALLGIPLANDPPGRWRIRATDVATGAAAEAAVAVR